MPRREEVGMGGGSQHLQRGVKMNKQHPHLPPKTALGEVQVLERAVEDFNATSYLCGLAADSLIIFLKT